MSVAIFQINSVVPDPQLIQLAIASRSMKQKTRAVGCRMLRPRSLRNAELLAKSHNIATALFLDPFLKITTHKVRLGNVPKHMILKDADFNQLKHLLNDFELNQNAEKFWDELRSQSWFTKILARHRVANEHKGVLKDVICQYLYCFKSDSGFKIKKCSRFTSQKPGEAQVISKNKWQKGNVIQNLTAKCVPICSSTEDKLDGLGSGDFVLKIDTRSNSLFCLGPAAFLNHSCEHNAKLASFNKETGVVLVEATKSIKFGQEITLCYGANYFDHCECVPCIRKIKIRESEKLYAVKEVLAKRAVNGGVDVEYLVSWEGYEAVENSWEPKTGLKFCSELIEKFEKLSSTKIKNHVQHLSLVQKPLVPVTALALGLSAKQKAAVISSLRFNPTPVDADNVSISPSSETDKSSIIDDLEQNYAAIATGSLHAKSTIEADLNNAVLDRNNLQGQILDHENSTLLNPHRFQSSYLFICQICKGEFDDQPTFFEHLKDHYQNQADVGVQSSIYKMKTTKTKQKVVYIPKSNDSSCVIIYVQG